MQRAEDKVNCDEYFAREEEKFNAFHQQTHEWIARESGRFDTKSFRYKSIRFVTFKSFRYRILHYI